MGDGPYYSDFINFDVATLELAPPGNGELYRASFEVTASY